MPGWGNRTTGWVIVIQSCYFTYCSGLLSNPHAHSEVKSLSNHDGTILYYIIYISSFSPYSISIIFASIQYSLDNILNHRHHSITICISLFQCIAIITSASSTHYGPILLSIKFVTRFSSPYLHSFLHWWFLLDMPY